MMKSGYFLIAVLCMIAAAYGSRELRDLQRELDNLKRKVEKMEDMLDDSVLEALDDNRFCVLKDWSCPRGFNSERVEMVAAAPKGASYDRDSFGSSEIRTDTSRKTVKMTLEVCCKR